MKVVLLFTMECSRLGIHNLKKAFKVFYRAYKRHGLLIALMTLEAAYFSKLVR